MELSQKQTVSIIAWLLIAAAVSQPIYTALYIQAPEINRTFLWGIEGVIFTLLAAFAGSALVMAKRCTLGFSAIVMSAVLNVVQVGVGLTMFGTFREAATAVEGLAPAASGVVAFSFFGYNAAKVLLGLAALVFGMAKQKQGSKALGGLTAFVGVVALISNAVVMFGLEYSITSGGLMPSGASGVLATILLAICLLTMPHDD